MAREKNSPLSNENVIRTIERIRKNSKAKRCNNMMDSVLEILNLKNGDEFIHIKYSKN